MYFIREMPVRERPREKLINNGVKSLTNIELIAILLRTGNSDKSVIELAKDVLYSIEELSELKKLSYHCLTRIPGIKTAKASTILAAIELGSRLEKLEFKDKIIDSSHQIYEMMSYLKHEEQEHFYCIFLNTRLAFMKKELIYKGTKDKIALNPTDLFKQAIKHNASYMIIVHNHPTGNAKPSAADVNTTKDLIEVSKILNIEILDHIIIGNDQYYSFQEKQINYL